jgi:fructokinase
MRIGIDLGGTKTEILVMDPGGAPLWRKRVPSARDFAGTVAVIAALAGEAEDRLGACTRIGIAIPGCETADGTIKNANATWLNGRRLRADLQAALGRDVRLANDANCFTLSEARDGAGAGARVVFGVIAGTGVGGAIAIDGQVLGGAHGISGEWGHMPLPWPSAEELHNAPACYCGKHGCMETWCSGPALAADFQRTTGAGLSAQDIAASTGHAEQAAMDRLVDRLARGLAVVTNIVDPDAIVLGGGLSNVERLYRDLGPLVEHYAFTLGGLPRIVKNMHGDSSGVRGAAWLWPESQT